MSKNLFFSTTKEKNLPCFCVDGEKMLFLHLQTNKVATALGHNNPKFWVASNSSGLYQTTKDGSALSVVIYPQDDSVHPKKVQHNNN